jgi:N-acetylmuramoyl-L-alanine amidase
MTMSERGRTAGWPRYGFGAVAAVAVMSLAVPAFAQSAATLYQRAQTRERAVRADRDANAASVRTVARSYESIVRRYPTSGYADNALWQAADLMGLAYARSGDQDDRDAAEHYLTWLRREYPSSSLLKQIPAKLTALKASASAPAPAAAPPAQASASTVTRSVKPGSAAVIRSVGYTPLPRGERITIELSKEVDYLGNRVEGPDRVFFDFTQAVPSAGLADRAATIQGSLVKELRFGRHANGVTRVVLDLAGAPRYSSFPLYNPFRLVIDVESSGPPAPAPAVESGPAAPPPTRIANGPPRPQPPPDTVTTPALANVPVSRTVRVEAPPPTSPPPSNPPAPPPPAATPTPAPPATTSKGDYSLARQLGLGISRIVIDAGHGGHDPGARANGLTEADLVLDIAQRVAKLLRAQRGIEVVMTRDKDVFIPLEERTAIANKVDADLFLSIHANASRNTAARGIETYVLNFASNPAAEEVAARENATSGRAMGTLPELIRAIALNNKLQESRELATMVQTALARSLRTQSNGVRDLGVKQAPFVVLIGAQMPSVLAEISFVTHRAEANLLKQTTYRQRIAQALCDALMKYQASLRRITTDQ